MVKIIIKQDKPRKKNQLIANLIHSAINEKIQRLKYAITVTKNHLSGFEKKYKVSTSEFIKKYSAEDLQGGDIEYVEWAGEYKLLKGLESELSHLQEIKYAKTG